MNRERALAPLGAADGFRHLLVGFSLLNKPGIRPFVVIPLLVNIIVFAGLVWLAGDRFDALMDWLTPQLPEWLAWLAWIAWVLFAVLAALLVFYTFTLVANLLASPFNGFLAERVARHLGVENPELAERPWTTQVAEDIRQELRKLAYFVTRAAGLGLLSLLLLFIPLVNALVPLAWFAFGAWMLALEYSDFHLANQGVRFETQRQLLRRNLSSSLGFGAAAALATLVPILNFLVMPAAVAGATALWCRRLEGADSGASIR